MKKLILAASLFLALTMSAQQTQQDHKERPTVEQQMKEFDGMNLTNKQKSKLEKLYKEREQEMEKNRPEPPQNGEHANHKNSDDRQGPPPPPPSNGNDSNRPRPGSDMKGGKMDEERLAFDKKVQKILNHDQYAQYQANQKKHRDMMKLDGNGKQQKERNTEYSNQ